MKVNLFREKPSNKEFASFLMMISKLEPIEFEGLAKCCGVATEQKQYAEVLSEILDKYETAPKKGRKNIYLMLWNVLKEKEKEQSNGNKG